MEQGHERTALRNLSSGGQTLVEWGSGAHTLVKNLDSGVKNNLGGKRRGRPGF